MRNNYNHLRPKLFIPEYGRHIQNMVNTLPLIEDRAERNKQARAVIAVMGNLNPLLRDTPVFTHKLWDHLFIMSDFKLDVDSPYEQPSRDELDIRPEKLEYPQHRIRHKHYGKYIERIIKSLKGESAENIASTIDDVAVFLRAKSFEFNQEHPNNEAIIKDIKQMSAGGIEIDENAINKIQSDYKQHLNSQSTKPLQRTNGRNQHKSRSQHTSRSFVKNAPSRRNHVK